MVSPRFWWLVIGIAALVLIIVGIWVFYPRPSRSAAPMPTSGVEKRQRWQGAIQKSLQQSLQQGAREAAPR